MSCDYSFSRRLLLLLLMCFVSANVQSFHGTVCHPAHLHRLSRIATATHTGDHKRIQSVSTGAVDRLIANDTVSGVRSIQSASAQLSDEFIEYGTSTPLLRWDSTTKKFKSVASWDHERQAVRLMEWLRSCLLPNGNLSPDYYRYTSWRAAARFVSATCDVFGSQALLLALGFKDNRIGLAAATKWVIKDALGKVSRIFWASKNGRKFDSDAKKWRFRASLLFAFGSTLQILTNVFPSFFIAFAAIANAAKQMAMVTSSATRNTIYKSFSYGGDNIGDITAKGESQIAIIDLLGMASGIFLSYRIGESKMKIAILFTILSTLDLLCIVQEIRSLVFRALNFERMTLAMKRVFPAVDRAVAHGTAGKADANQRHQLELVGGVDLSSFSPTRLAQMEQLLYPNSHGESMVKTWSSLQLRDAQLMQQFWELFATNDEKFIVMMHARTVYSRLDALTVQWKLRAGQELCGVNAPDTADGELYPVVIVPEILLHVDATPEDIFRALLIVHRVCYEFHDRNQPITATQAVNVKAVVRSVYKNSSDQEILCKRGYGGDDMFKAVSSAYAYEQQRKSDILHLLQAAGWDTNRFMFSTIRRRVDW